MAIASVAGLPPEVVPAMAKNCVAASSSATKNDGSEGLVICEPVIAARAAVGWATSPPKTSALARAAPAAGLIPGNCTAPPLRRRAQILPRALLGAAGVRAAVAARV